MIPVDFDFAVLDDPGFKEDAVREEIVAPILRSLGYRSSGDVRVERGKALKHPYVILGTTKRPLTLVPDYLLYKQHRAIAVLDAKSPSESLLGGIHLQQVYSYAIHPEVRCDHFALCNGRELIVWDVATLQPVLKIATSEINNRWADVERAMHYTFLEEPFRRDFRPDFGVALLMSGFDLRKTTIDGLYVDLLAKVDATTFTASCGAKFSGDVEYLASVDMTELQLVEVLQSVPLPQRTEVRAALERAPFHVATNGKVRLSIEAQLGDPSQGRDESFVPLIMKKLLKSNFDPSFVYAEPREPYPPCVTQL